MYPKPSQFELPESASNTLLHVRRERLAVERRRMWLAVGLGAVLCVLAALMLYALYALAPFLLR
jgi:Tfp pilus assembly protein PilN